MMSKKDFKLIADALLGLLSQLPIEQWRLVRDHLIGAMRFTYNGFDEGIFRAYLTKVLKEAVE